MLKLLTAAGQIAAFLVSFMVPGFVMGAPRCKAVLADDFWKSREPLVFAQLPTCLTLSPTFSYDSEITLGDVWDRVARTASPEELTKARQLFDQMIPRFTKYDLLSSLHVSEKQLAAFVLRPSVDAKQDSFAATELRPSALHASEDSIYDQMRAWDAFLPRFLLPALEESGLRANAHMDGTSPELTHPSSEIVPASFAKDIQRLHSLFPKAATHLHIGLPAYSVSRNDATEIGHAVEARIVLGLILSSPPADQALIYNGSTFIGPNDEFGFNGVRENIKLGLYDPDNKTGFNLPFPAHDLEIRQWRTIADGLTGLRIAALLGHKAAVKALTHQSVDAHLFLNDPRYGSVAASLDYIGSVLASMPEARDLGGQMKVAARRAISEETHESKGAFAQKYARQSDAWVLRESFINELKLFCRRNDIAQKYDTALLK